MLKKKINAVLLNFVFIKGYWKKDNSFFKNMKQHNCYYGWIIIRHFYWAVNHHTRMISEESCDWRVMMKSWKSSFDHMNKLHYNIYSNWCYFSNNISYYYCFSCTLIKLCNLGEQKNYVVPSATFLSAFHRFAIISRGYDLILGQNTPTETDMNFI